MASLGFTTTNTTLRTTDSSIRIICSCSIHLTYCHQFFFGDVLSRFVVFLVRPHRHHLAYIQPRICPTYPTLCIGITCTCTCSCTYTCICTCTCPCTCIYSCTCTGPYTCPCPRSSTGLCTCPCTNTCTCICSCTCTFACVYSSTCSCTCIYAFTCTGPCTFSCTRSSTCSSPCTCSCTCSNCLSVSASSCVPRCSISSRQHQHLLLFRHAQLKLQHQLHPPSQSFQLYYHLPFRLILQVHLFEVLLILIKLHLLVLIKLHLI